MTRLLLDAILSRFVRQGRLTLRYPDNHVSTHGPGGSPEASVTILAWRAVRGFLLNPALEFGEAYTRGDIQLQEGRLEDLLDLLFGNIHTGGTHPLLTFRRAVARLTRAFAQYNPIPRARRNVARHYDLNGRLYSLFLDRDRQYSCAYFPRGDETLEEAQAEKKRHIAHKLLLDRPGLRVLDIGCGWGGMALTLAGEYGAHVTGITLSAEQFQEARARAAAATLSGTATFHLEDYRSVRGTYDRIVCIGMFEHVGVTQYRDFFAAIGDLLSDDGIALIHAIGRSDGPSVTNPWITRHIFPGGYSPALSEVLRAVEQEKLVATDIEILRLHYAETLRHWRRRFEANRDAIAALYDESFTRLFDLYLTGSEYSFRHLNHMVWQLQLAKNQHAVPLTRDYMISGAATARTRSTKTPTLSRSPGA
jgi:cyclopropane-fatty-acyl-phospholipid synthase